MNSFRETPTYLERDLVNDYAIVMGILLLSRSPTGPSAIL